MSYRPRLLVDRRSPLCRGCRPRRAPWPVLSAACYGHRFSNSTQPGRRPTQPANPTASTLETKMSGRPRICCTERSTKRPRDLRASQEVPRFDYPCRHRCQVRLGAFILTCKGERLIAVRAPSKRPLPTQQTWWSRPSVQSVWTTRDEEITPAVGDQATRGRQHSVTDNRNEAHLQKIPVKYEQTPERSGRKP